MQNKESCQSQQEPETSRDRYADLYDSAPVGYLTLSQQGAILEANLTAAALLGTDREFLVGELLSRFVDREDWDAADAHYREAFEASGVHTCRLRMVKVNGASFDTQVQSIVMRDCDDCPRCQTIIADISEWAEREKRARIDWKGLEQLLAERTAALEEAHKQLRDAAAERMQAMEALQRSQARLAAILESTAIGIGVVDAEGRFVYSNAALQGILGYSRTELRGVAFADLTHAEDAAADIAHFAELVDGERDHYEIDQRYVRGDGRTIWCRVTASLIRGTGEQGSVAVLMVRDITRYRADQEALIQAEKLAVTGRLATSLAHEINNPLQAVIGCLGLAESKLDRGEDVSRYLEVAHTELRRAARIVVQLRDMHRRSRPEDRQLTDLHALLERVLTVSSRQCQSRRIEVALQVATDVPPVMVVPDRMEQVFMNLVLNAVEALPRGGQLEIGAVHTDDPNGVSIWFTDNGIGIPPEALPHLFKPFYTTRGDGVGLGLYISHNIVEEHGGRLEVESAEGEGTTFTVWLPI